MATQTDEKTQTEEESSTSSSSPFVLKGRIRTQNNEEIGQMEIVVQDEEGYKKTYPVPGTGVFNIPLAPKRHRVFVRDPVGRYHNIDFESSPTDVGEIMLNEIPPDQRLKLNVDFNGPGGGGKSPLEIEKTNQYIQSTIDEKNITVENDFDKHIDQLDVEALSKKYNLTPEEKTEIESKIVHLKSEQQRKLETTRKNAIARFIPRSEFFRQKGLAKKEVLKLDTKNLSEELQEKIVKVQNGEKAQKEALALKEKFELDDKETENLQTRLQNIYGQRYQFTQALEKQLKERKITKEEFDQRVAATVSNHFLIHSETFDNALDKKIQAKFVKESTEKQAEITKKAKDVLENRSKKIKDEQEIEKIRTSIRKSLAERERKQRENKNRLVIQNLEQNAQNQQTNTASMERESPSSYRLRMRPSPQGGPEPAPTNNPPSPPNMRRPFPGFIPRLGSAIRGAPSIARLILMTPQVRIGLAIGGGVLLLVVLIMALFFKFTEEVPQDIAYCKFYKTRLVEGSLKPVSVALGSASGKALIDAISPIVNATRVPAPLIFAIMRVDREEAFHASIEYAIADYDKTQDRQIQYDLTTEYGIGIMQIAPSQFEDIFNDPQYKGVFESLGKTSINKVIEPQESPPPNDSEDLKKRSVLRIASIKDNVLAATTRMLRFKDISFPNPDQEWNEEVVKKVAEMYRGNCFYNNVDGAAGNYCDDIWKGYSECEIRLGQEIADPNTPIPGLTISKNGPPTANVGDTVTYTLTISYSQDEDVLIVEPIPANTTLVSATPGFKQDGNNISWRLKEMQATVSPSAPNVKTYTFQLQVRIVADPTLGNDFYVTNTAFGRLLGDPGIGPSTEFSTLMAGQGRNVTILGDENSFVSRVIQNQQSIPLSSRESQLRELYRYSIVRNVNPLAVLAVWGVEASFRLNGTEFGCKPFGGGFTDQLHCSANTFDNWMKDFTQRNIGGAITIIGVRTCTFTDPFVYAYEKYTPVCAINDSNDAARTNFVKFYRQLGGP